MTDDNFDKLWASFKSSLVEARENRMFASGTVELRTGSVNVESDEDGTVGLLVRGRGTSNAWVEMNRQQAQEVAAHILCAIEEMKPETNYKPSNK